MSQMTIDELLEYWAGCPQNDLHEALREFIRDAAIVVLLDDIRKTLSMNDQLRYRAIDIDRVELEARLRELIAEALRHD